jgi:hypothetical protein
MRRQVQPTLTGAAIRGFVQAVTGSFMIGISLIDGAYWKAVGLIPGVFPAARRMALSLYGGLMRGIHIFIAILCCAFAAQAQVPGKEDILVSYNAVSAWPLTGLTHGSVASPVFPKSHLAGTEAFKLKAAPMANPRIVIRPVALIEGSELALIDPVTTLQTIPARPKAITLSRGYEVRAKIHKYAAYSMFPIFAAEAVIGQKLFNEISPSGSLKSAHSALAGATYALFGINSVTGVWNLMETHKDPKGRGKRMFHSILMLAADAGFVATAALAPSGEEFRNGTSDASTHRAVAFASIGVATVSYLYIIFAK